MAISLYDLSVRTHLQILGAVAHVLDRGLAHFKEKGENPDEIAETRLFADMLPFRFQVQSVAHHSAGAIEGVRAGSFSPPPPLPPLGYVALQGLVTGAQDSLQKLSPEEVNALEGKDVFFRRGESSIPFTAEDFLLSFSLPNFYFHATTTYDILRMKGVPLGKRDFMGQMRIKA